MSRTDQTRPMGVRVMDRRRWLEEVHDHADGPCDLPPRPRGRCDTFWGGGETRCHWRASYEFLRGPGGSCGCPSHSYKHSRWGVSERAAKKTSRRRAEYGALVDARAYGADDLADVPDLFDDFHSVIDHFARLAELLDLPDGSLVVDVEDYLSDGMDGRVEVLHPDGRREIRKIGDPNYVVPIRPGDPPAWDA